MPRYIKAGGKIHKFPDNATDADISSALDAIPEANAARVPKAQTWADAGESVLEMSKRRVTSDTPEPEAGSLSQVVEDVAKGMAHPGTLSDVANLFSAPVRVIGGVGAASKVATGTTSAAKAGTAKTGRVAEATGTALEKAADSEYVRWGSRALAGILGLKGGMMREAIEAYAIPPLMKGGGRVLAAGGKFLQKAGEVAAPAVSTLADEAKLVVQSVEKGMDPSTAIRIVADGSAEYADALRKSFEAYIKANGAPRVVPESVRKLMQSPSFAKLPKP